MPSGTILNGVFAPRIHKSTASVIAEDAREQIEHYKERLVAMASYTPGKEDIEMIPGEIAEIVSELAEHTLSLRNAEYIIEYGDECVDELENT